ncbi:MAG: alanine racemase [Planctomycetota bacterium]
MPHSERFDASAYELPEESLRTILSPALVIYRDRVRENLARVLSRLGGDPERWRPHVKTAKVPVIFAEFVNRGVRHFKCATTREATLLAATLAAEAIEAADILVAYPVVGPALARLSSLAERHPSIRFSVLCDDPAGLAELPPALSVFVDVNPGMDRTGIPLAEGGAIRSLAARCGARFRGLHFYEGHLGDLPAAARRTRAFAGYGELLSLARDLERAGLEIEEIVTSGTPTFTHAVDYRGFRDAGFRHRVSPGTVVYHDLRSAETLPELGLQPAALVLTRVISHPASALVTCDAGSKSIAAEAGHPVAAVLGRPGLEPRVPSEEHLPLAVVEGRPPARGEVLLLFPRHVCPTVNLAEEALVVEERRVVDIAPVSARAHDLWAGP